MVPEQTLTKKDDFHIPGDLIRQCIVLLEIITHMDDKIYQCSLLNGNTKMSTKYTIFFLILIF